MFHLVLILVLFGSSVHSVPVVLTRYGLIGGITGSYDIDGASRHFEAFLGIPFAEPPLGNKRFQIPVPIKPKWTEPYDATRFRDACAQSSSIKLSANTSEDCLYLNIWRPEFELNEPSSKLLPVYYHIHGGQFVKNSGSVPDYRGDVLAASQKIIFVNSNYRLGVFGFGYGSPDEMVGNVGIYDTLLALRWIQENIRSFGGDPKRVTLTGLSSGGKIATIIASLPRKFNSTSLFSQALMMSGASTFKHQVESIEIGVNKTRLLAYKVNCLCEYDEKRPSSPKLSVKTIECLRKRSADTLVEAQSSSEINALGASADSPFLPVYGTPLIPDRPMVNHIKNLNNIKDMPMIFGSEQDESKPFPSVEAVVTLQDAYNFTKEDVTYSIANVTKHQIDLIFNSYFTDADPNNTHDLRSRCVQLTSDIKFTCPSLVLAELFSLVSRNIFLYRNVYIGQNLTRPFGTQHSDDTIFGQGAPYREPNLYTPADRQFSSLLMKFYGSFVKGISLNWTPVYLNQSDPNAPQTIKEMSLTLKDTLDLNQKRCSSWAKFFGYEISDTLNP